MISWNFFHASQSVFLYQVSLIFSSQLTSTSTPPIYLEALSSVIFSWQVLVLRMSVQQNRRLSWIRVSQFASWVSKNWQAIDEGLMLVLHINSIFIIHIFTTVWKFITDITVIGMISFFWAVSKLESLNAVAKL